MTHCCITASRLFLTVVAVALPAFCEAIETCEALRRSWSLRGTTTAVAGSLGVSQHGLVLASRTECPGLDGHLTSWPRKIYLITDQATRLTPEVREAITYALSYSKAVPPKEVVVKGILTREFFPLIFRLRGGGYGGNGYGANGQYAVALVVRSIEIKP